MPENKPLRICFLVAYFHPFESGAERQALAQGEELVRLGHSVHVVTHAMPGVPAEDDVRGIKVHRCIRSSKRGPLFSISFVAGAVRGLMKYRDQFDLIHTHQALWEAVAAGVARSGFVRGIPTIIQPASSGYYGEAEELSRTKGSGLLRRLILRNDAFVAISKDIAEQWTRLGVPPSKLVTIASGVDARHFHHGPSAIEHQFPTRPRVVFTGRLHPQKNLDVLLDAWPKVATSTNANLVLVGQGPEREQLESKAQALGIVDRVHFFGAVPDVADALRAADVFVLPSVAEGMSNSLLEAMATGLPCIASDIGGNQDLLRPEAGNEAGVLVSESTAESWADAITGLLKDSDRAQKLGLEARGRIDTVYDLRLVVETYIALYRSLLKDLARFREGEPPGEPGVLSARREPRPPGMTQGD